MDEPESPSPKPMIQGLFQPGGDTEQFIVAWLKSKLSSDVLLTRGYSEAKPDIGMILIKPESYNGPPSLLHESMHIWLGIRKKGYSNKFINKDPLDINLRGEVEQYRHLTGQVVDIVLLEGKIGPDHMKRLEKGFGKPEDYDVLNKPGASLYDPPAGRSWIGNLVDETATLGFPQSKGHPMQNYHEFFASFVTTMAFDGDEFFKRLDSLKQLAGKGRECNELQALTLSVLREAHKDCVSLLDELKSFSGTQSISMPPIQRLETNLARLKAAIPEEGKKRIRS